MAGPVDETLLRTVRDWIASARTVVALTGAGISTDSGIPDFRGPQGVWTTNPKAERMSDISHYVNDPEVRRLSWQARLAHPAWTAEPSAGHRALVDMARAGRLHLVVTQNIDGLHQKAGSDPATVVEVHGTLHEVTCLSCAERAPMERALERVRAGEQDPPCRSCGGILKSATVSFGQNLDPGDLDRAFAAAHGAEVLLCIGTTLTVYPVAAMPEITQRQGGRVVTVNAEATAFDGRADAVLRGQIADVVPALVIA